MLAEKYNIASDVWSVTSYNQLRRDAQDCERWNMFHPDEPPKLSYIERALSGVKGPFIAASDYVRAVPEQLLRYIPGDYFVLEPRWMGRANLAKLFDVTFEVDSVSITIATLHRLTLERVVTVQEVKQAMQDLEFDPNKPNPFFA